MNHSEIDIVIDVLESLIAMMEKVDPDLENNFVVQAILKAMEVIRRLGI